MSWSGKAATAGNGVLEEQRGTEGLRVLEKQGGNYGKRFLEKKEQQMHDMVSSKEKTVSAKNGILDRLGSDYRKSLDGAFSSYKIHIVSSCSQCISQCLYICATLP
jgi:hypothetical protein